MILSTSPHRIDFMFSQYRNRNTNAKCFFPRMSNPVEHHPGQPVSSSASSHVILRNSLTPQIITLQKSIPRLEPRFALDPGGERIHTRPQPALRKRPTAPPTHFARYPLSRNGNSSSIRLLGQTGSFSIVCFNQAQGSIPLSLAVANRL